VGGSWWDVDVDLDAGTAAVLDHGCVARQRSAPAVPMREAAE
jgi:hypothetical protein